MLIGLDGSDFLSVLHNITFLAGNTDIVFDTIIQDDNIFEMDETFDHMLLLIIPSSRAIGIVNGTTTVVIMDNDRKCKIQDKLFVYSCIYSY